ncbi:hypothetical protein Bca52824_095957 [Brassica carinata]|uniref:Succinate dehydogenase/fumarate reductase N-terminal domain-containing protein n=1 Tax=Brassica carinata TaxID=52824 RepID=A0A8X7NZD4_BRACI|nr:hypothetical protein Bca52824_095957 [Brassica carinata]
MASGLIGRFVRTNPSRLTTAARLIPSRCTASSTDNGGKASNLKTFQIYRWNPDNPSKPEPKTTRSTQGLWPDGPRRPNQDQERDGSALTFRRVEGICVASPMNIDGATARGDEDRGGSKETTITPLPHMFVIKDLVVDMTNFIISIRVSSRG